MFRSTIEERQETDAGQPRDADPAAQAHPGHHREHDDSLVVVLNPPTEPSRAHRERERGLLLRPWAESDKQEPA